MSICGSQVWNFQGHGTGLLPIPRGGLRKSPSRGILAAGCPVAPPTLPLSSREPLIEPPGGALLKMPLPKVRLSPVLEGLPLLPCCLSEDAADARSHFPLTLVPSPAPHVPFLTTVRVLGGGSEGHVHCLASIKKLCLPPPVACSLPGAFKKGYCFWSFW